MHPILAALILRLIALLLAGGLFAISICKISRHLSQRSFGKVFFYSVLIALGIKILVYSCNFGPMMMKNIMIP